MGYSIESRQAQYMTIEGKRLILFSSNDYLGLSHHPEVVSSATEATERFGCGTGGAPGTSGTTSLHEKLADEIAQFKHREKGVIFPSGYAANVALHQSLGDKDTAFFYDEKSHPSAVDGIKLAGCASEAYRHLDFDHLESLLQESKKPRKIVSVCSVFTLDGAICPLDTLDGLKRKYRFSLILDEAHATGCIGQTGKGLEELYSLTGAADFIMGTFSKALGSQGGFLAYTQEAQQMLTISFRTYEYSTSIASPTVAASLQALAILKREPQLVLKMRANIKKIYNNLNQHGFRLNDPNRHIINVFFESQEQARQIINTLYQRGYYIVPVKFNDRWGIRITAMAVHTETEIDGFCKNLIEAVSDSVKA